MHQTISLLVFTLLCMGLSKIVSRLRFCMRNKEFRPTEFLREQKGMAESTDAAAAVATVVNVHRQYERIYYYATFLHVYANVCQRLSICVCVFDRLFSWNSISVFFSRAAINTISHPHTP